MGLILNTRPAMHHERFHEAFGDLDWAIYDCPLTVPEPMPMDTPSPAGFDTLIFTSQLAVTLFAPSPQWLAKKVLTVGAATAAAAKKAGFQDVVQTGQDVEDLRSYVAENAFNKAFYPSAEDVTAELETEFPERIRREAAYRMTARWEMPKQIVAEIRKGTAIAAPLFSRRNAEIFAQLLGKAGITAENATIAAIGMSADVFDGPGPWKTQLVAAQPVTEDLVAKTGEAIAKLGG